MSDHDQTAVEAPAIADVTTSYAPATPAYAAPAAPALVPDPAPASAGAPAAPVAAPAIPQQPVYEAAAPAVGYPAPAAPAYVPGYAAPVSAPGAYAAPVSAPGAYAVPVSAPAGYPVAAGYGAPVPAPAKPRKTGVIVMSILAALFLLSSLGMAGLFVASANDLAKEKKTAQSQATQIQDLSQQISDTKTQLSNLQTSTSGQIDDLKQANEASKACVNDIDAFMNLPASSSNSTLDKAWNKMVKACIVAKASID